MEEEILQLDISYKRERLTKTIYSISKIYLIGAFVTALFDLINAYKMLQMLSHIPEEAKFRAQYWGGVVFALLYALLLPIQAYLFYQFAVKMKNVNLAGDSEELSMSLRYLLGFAITAAVLFGTNAIWAIYDIAVFYL